MTPEAISRKLVRNLTARPTMRAGSLITTVFGDAIAPRGGVVWLGSLIRAMQQFGINERLVRTSVFRLARDGWIESRQIGRRSYYSLTDEGSEKFEQATHRIYGEPSREWDGRWCLVLLGALEASDRERLRKEAGWLGFAAMSTNVLAHPTPDMADLEITIKRLKLDDDVVVMSGQTVRSEAALRRLAHSSWNLDGIDARYAKFVSLYRPLLRALQKAPDVDPSAAFILRSLLIQDYRKILLRDPQLPDELLPAGWHGSAAYQLCRNLYHALYRPAEDYLAQNMENADGPLPPASRASRARFGGLPA